MAGWLTTYYTHGQNLILLKFTIKQLEMSLNSSCLTSHQYLHEIEAKCVSQSKMGAKARNDLASAIKYQRDIIKPLGLKNDVMHLSM